MLKRYRSFSKVNLGLAFIAAALAGSAESATAFENVKTFNLYGRNHFDPGDTQKLAQYDAIGLDVDVPASILAEIRSFNPNVKILAYIPINGTWEAAPLFPAGSKWREMYDACEANDWWMYNTNGDHVYDHPGKWTANMTADCPVNGQGKRFTDWFPDFIAQSVLQNGASPWDGVILDDVWVGIYFINTNTELNPFPIDANRDGEADGQTQLDALWRTGNESAVNRLRQIMPANEILIGNGGNPFYQMNGAMIETFPFKGQPEGHPLGFTWTSKMFGTYGYFQDEDNYSSNPIKMNVVNTKWALGDRNEPLRTAEFERQKRFVLASTMLRDGYFSIDYAPETGGGHFSIWIEPEFTKPIGTPIGAPYQATYNGMTLWRRDYTNGSVILNHNLTTFMGSAADGLPPIAWADGRVLLTSEFWQPGETVPPAAVNDLAVTRTWGNQIEIQWTNVGDDGTSGQATLLEARYSTSPITSGNWGSATAVPTVLPTLPGQAQALIIAGLVSSQTYYFAVKTRDMAGNWSAISNVPSGVTVVGDTTPPNATTLTVLSTTSTTATVQWTATGDDGGSGTASQFDLRYATFPLTAANFNSAASVVGEPTPGAPGVTHQLTTLGMQPNTTYYFGIRVGDEMPNWSAISNIPSAATLAGDTTPPAPIPNLAVSSFGTTSISLTWTAPGDDGNTGKAFQYDMRYSQSPINASNFDGAAFITTEPSPATSGVTENLTITGLGNGYTYYFALKTRDEVSNWSTISNTVTATTGGSGDTTPPSAVANLSAGSITSSGVTLSWTAPGDDGNTGTAAAYEIRYSPVALNNGNFSSGTLVSSPPAPTAPGTTQTRAITGLVASTVYYFAIKTRDEIPNWSAISNVPTATTAAAPPPPDTTPPAAVANLSAGSITSSGVTLSWTAPGDDGNTGTATAYEFRYSTSPLNSGNFSAGTLVSSPPTPTAAGTTQTKAITGLAASTLYYFAMKTRDEVPNWSAISVVVSATTSAPPPPPDTTPPAAVSNLSAGSITSSGVTLSWTASGDDGSSGTAAAYEIRYSTAALNSGNFSSGTLVSSPPAPTAAGTTQTKAVTGLSASTLYYFAIKTRDEVPNWSAISNVPTATTSTPPDATPPAAVTNLSAGSITSSGVTLSWTAPGDDGVTGTAAAYEIRYASVALTSGNFSSGTLVSSPPAPTAPGTTQTKAITGLSAGTLYFFAIKARDEVPNWSVISNVPTATTLLPPDITPPAAVTNLSITLPDTASVTLSWTAPGDDGSTGTATAYDIRYSTSALNSLNFNSGTPVPSPPAPAAAGTLQTKKVTGLLPGTTYYFALKTRDEVPNWSAISNTPSGATTSPPPPPDTTPPANVTNLLITNVHFTGLTLTWTAPGDNGSVGTAATFDLRTSESQLGPGTFAGATPVPGVPVPGPAGTVHTLILTNMVPGSTHYYAIKTGDEVPNWSGISNIVSVTLPVDTSPPAAPENLTGTRDGNIVTLRWTPNSEVNLAGYNLYRRRPGGSWMLQNDDPFPLPGCMDTLSSRPQTMEYAVAAVNDAGVEGPLSLPVEIMIDDLLPLPTLQLSTIGPNPFRGPLTFEVRSGAVDRRLRIDILDTQGRLVRALFAGEPAGVTLWTWDGRDEAGIDQPSGIYFIRVLGDETKETRKVVRVR